ncbi:MAG: hypothetical protein K8R40_05860 [Anaerolineaceae bacterium]|nr:hypothetical protein [Anaerolineaceae bacterium]
MSTILHIPFHLNTGQLAEKLRIKPQSGLIEEFTQLMDQVQKVAQPKVLYKTSYIENRTKDKVTIDGITFTSAALQVNLKGINRVFAYVATCGAEVDNLYIDPKDFVKITWLHYIKLELLKPCVPFLRKHLATSFGVTKLSSMSPGSADASIWPIQQQADLFRLIGEVKTLVGVRLTESFLMAPDVSISGILFPSDVIYQNCQLCQRENCPGRSAVFSAALWAEIHHTREE